MFLNVVEAYGNHSAPGISGNQFVFSGLGGLHSQDSQYSTCFVTED